MAISIPSSPAKTSTLEEFVSLSSKTLISYKNLSFIEKIDNEREISIWNVLSDYSQELKNICVDVELSDTDFRKYGYNPKVLAYDLYGSTELFFIILAANGICTAKEFNNKIIKLIRPKDLEEFIQMVYNANKHDIETYNEKQTSSEDYW